MEKLNNIYATPKYKCAICDKVHDSIEARSKCETACLKKQKEAELKAAVEKSRIEKEKRKEELLKSIKATTELLKAYEKDYGAITIAGVLENFDDKFGLTDKYDTTKDAFFNTIHMMTRGW